MDAIKFEILLALYKGDNFLPVSDEEESCLKDCVKEGLVTYNEDKLKITEAGKEQITKKLINR